MGIVKSNRETFPGFSLAERDRRWGLVQQLLEAEDLAAVVVFGDRDGIGQPLFTPDTWLTNDRMGHVVVVPRGGEPNVLVAAHLLIGDNIEALARGDATWMHPGNMYAANVAGRVGAGRGGAAVAQFLRDHGLDKGRIGVVGLEPTLYFPDGPLSYGTFKAMLDGCPAVEFVPVWRQLAMLMIVRSAEEIAAMELSALAGERMCEALIESAKPGAWEHEVYAAGMEACYLTGATCAGYILVKGPDGQNVSWGPPPWAYRAQTPRKIENGDVLLFELFPVWGQIESQQQLTIAVGDIHPDIERAHVAARAAYDAGLAVSRPGVLFEEVVKAMGEPVTAAGGWNLTPHIHSINPLLLHGGCGLNRSVPGVENYSGLGEVMPTGGNIPLQAGMSFAFEPNCVIGKRRVNIGGSVVITDTGVRELNVLANHMQRV